MQVAILSDIHSNCFALEAVLNEMTSLKLDRALLLGDVFGYYPWPCETYELLDRLEIIAIKGNHDALLMRQSPSTPAPSYWDAIVHNRETLTQRQPEALRWIASLGFTTRINLDGVHGVLCHGTPEDPEHGRLYPDDGAERAWFPSRGRMLFLGHTHYPLHRPTGAGGVIFNPGSVGQPRDGNPMAAWGIMDTSGPSLRLMRTAYDVASAVVELRKMKWNARSIMALQKTDSGRLDEGC